MAKNPITPTTEPLDVIVRLDITVAQAQAVAAALDLFTRLSLGQFEEISSKFAHGEFRVVRHGDEMGRLPTEQECCEIRSLCAGLKRIAGHAHGGSFGIGSVAVSEKAHASYEVMKVLNETLALHRDPAPSFRGVDYDGLTVRYSTQPAPRCAMEDKGMRHA